jgi:hypothetical protein
MWYAGQIGLARGLASMSRGLQMAAGDAGTNRWSQDVEGAAGEMAVCKAFGIYFAGTVNTFHEVSDVANIEVRTRLKPEYELLVRPRDRDEDIFLLVTRDAPFVYVLRGWILGRDAKRPEWLQTHGGMARAYFVPTRALHDVDTLPIRAPALAA